MRPHFFLLPLVMLLVHHSYADNEWKQELNKDGVVVYTRITGQSEFKEFKGEIIIAGSEEKIASVIMDVEDYPLWCYKTVSAKVMEKDSSTIRYFYISETPFFLKTRVACFELTRTNNSEKRMITLTLTDIQCKRKLSDDMLLIPVMRGQWTLTPIEGGRVKVSMQMLTEPGGVIPSWLANLVVVESPYITLKNLSERVRQLGR